MESASNLLIKNAELNPDLVAIETGVQQVTYRELLELIHVCIENFLEPELTQEPIAVLCSNKLEDVVACLAITLSGNIYVPIDLTWPTKRVDKIIKKLSIKRCFVAGKLRRGVKQLLSELDLIVHQQNFYQPVQNPVLAFDQILQKLSSVSQYLDDEIMYIIFTSGTTGDPKAIPIKHRNVSALLEATKSKFLFKKFGVWSCCHSLAFDYSVWEIWGCFSNSGTLALFSPAENLDPELFAERIMSSKVTIFSITPTVFKMRLDSILEFDALSSVNYLIFGGEPLFTYIIQKVAINYPNIKIVNMYGITEVTVHASFYQFSDADNVGGAVPIGKLLPGLSLDRSIFRDGLMELVISGPQVFPGYISNIERDCFNKPHLNFESSVTELNESFATGDLVELLADGCLVHRGRADRIVKHRGYRVSLDEIEKAMDELLDGGVSLARLEPDPSDDKSLDIQQEKEVIVAYIPPNVGISRNISEFRCALAQVMPPYMLPDCIFTTTKISVSHNGKRVLAECGRIVLEDE